MNSLEILLAGVASGMTAWFTVWRVFFVGREMSRLFNSPIDTGD